MTDITIQPIGHIDTPFKQKFGIPRQANLADAPGVIKLNHEYTDANLFKGMEGFSHLWLLFQFDHTIEAGWKSTVKAPRLGGNATMGVFASRSTHRPNGIGMSAVKYAGWSRQDGQLCVEVLGVDLLDKTPILDIKPYLPYADKIENSHTPFTSASDPDQKPHQLSVTFCEAANKELAKYIDIWPGLPKLIEQVLAQDPRPAYKRKPPNDSKVYACQLYDVDVHWRVDSQTAVVLDITSTTSPSACVSP